MNYIKTKDGIVENVYGDNPQDTKWFFDKEIIAQAETIEELCDFKVEVISDDKSVAVRIFTMYKELPPNKDIKSGTYGAILTDKGLIYVAKMKGILPSGEIDWELL